MNHGPPTFVIPTDRLREVAEGGVSIPETEAILDRVTTRLRNHRRRAGTRAAA